jgi:murein DD-endopeptidase MepM/ murein hydrolase activator NlpD
MKRYVRYLAASLLLLAPATMAVAGYAQPPFITPTWGWLSSGQGWRIDPLRPTMWQHHWGIDIAAGIGTPVLTSAPGMVTFAGWYAGYGQTIYVDHGSGWTTLYAHLNRIDVQVGQVLERGETIGAVGSNGRSTGPHLHFEIRLNNRPVDPMKYLGR